MRVILVATFAFGCGDVVKLDTSSGRAGMVVMESFQMTSARPVAEVGQAV